MPNKTERCLAESLLFKAILSAIMVNVTYLIIMMSTIRTRVVMQSVLAPKFRSRKSFCKFHLFLQEINLLDVL
jgi:hypothetical protein